MDPLFRCFNNNLDINHLNLPIDHLNTDSLLLLIKQKEQLSKAQFAAIQDWGSITSAKNNLFSLLDQVTAFSEKSNLFVPQASTPPSPPTTPPTPPTPTPFEQALDKAKAAKTALETATTIETFLQELQKLQAALQEMETEASTDPDRATLSTWKTALASKQDIINKITQLNTILTTFSQFNTFLDTTTEVGKAYLYRGVVEKGLEEMKKLVKELTDANVTYSVIQDVQTKINQAAQQLTTKGEAVQQAYELGQTATALVKNAQNNNSEENIAAVKKQLASIKQTVQTLNTQYPSSTLIQQALQAATQAETDIGLVQPNEGFKPPLGTPGGSATVGSSQSFAEMKGSLKKISLILDNVDNETLGIMLQGFRSMIEQFHDQNATMRHELRGIDKQLLELDSTQEVDIQDELQQIEDLVLGEQAAAPASMSDAYASIAAASVKVGGVSQPAQVSSDVKQLYNTATSQGGDKGEQMAAGYDAWSRLNETFAANNEQVRDILNQTTRPALAREGSYIGKPSNADNRNMRAAHTIARNSLSLGEVYQRVRVLERGLSLINQNPNLSLNEVKQQLIEEISSAPRFGYPYTQLPSALAGKFVADLEKEFEEESLRLSKQKAAQFEIKPMYIQQVLVNIASLFSVYLNN